MTQEGSAISADAGHSPPEPSGTTALLLVDVINGFFEQSGSMWYPAVADVVGPLRRLLDAARSGGHLVVHAAERHRPGLRDLERLKLPEHCLAGGHEAESYEGFEPAPGEPVVPKRRYSAFYATDLDLLLREQGVGTLMVAGVKTNVCVRATVQDAFAAGYRVVLPREATSSNLPHLAEASLEDVDRYFGEVVELEEALERL